MAFKLFIFVSALGLINAASLPLYSYRHPGHIIVPAPALGPPLSVRHPIIQHPMSVHAVPIQPAPVHNLPVYLPARPLSAPPHQNGPAAAVAQNFPGHQQALSFAQNGPGYESAISSASSQGFGSALSSAQNAPGYQSALSLSNGNHGSSIAAALNAGAQKLSLAESVQHNGNSFQKSGASSIIVPGLQSAQSYATNYSG